MSPEQIVIIGGGLGGAKAAEALRAAGYDGSLTLVGAEQHLPYERPPLSKAYLQGKAPFDDAVVHPAEWYRDNNIDLRLGTRVTAIDPSAHTISLDDGTSVNYDKLLLATGSVNRRVNVPGVDATGVLQLRTRENSDAIRATFGPGHRLVIVGAGWIGLEVAAAAREAGSEVSIVEVADAPLRTVLGARMGAVFADLHRDNGVDLRLGTQLTEITVKDGRATGVRLGDGTTIEADAVIVAVGATPDVALAEQAGLDIDNGVLVDASLRTSDPDIYAVGDIANHDHPLLGSRVRVEHWATALNQPTVAAAAMLGQDAVYDELPYFFSDQYDVGMEYLGRADPESRVVVRGDPASREFVAFWLDDGDHIVASMNVNVWDVVDAIKPLITQRVTVDRDRLADPDVPFGDLAG